MGKKEKLQTQALKEQTTMPLSVDIELGENTFKVSGDVPDLSPVVDLFRIWVNSQQNQEGDPQKLAELTERLKGNQTQLAQDVQASTPTP